jgi:DNA-binding IclR family transcriptional regulator
MRSGRSFVLRPKVLELGAAYLESMNIEALTKTYLEDLASQTGDSAALTVPRRYGDRVCRACVGTHAAAARGARRQPAARVSDLDGDACCSPV